MVVVTCLQITWVFQQQPTAEHIDLYMVSQSGNVFQMLQVSYASKRILNSNMLDTGPNVVVDVIICLPGLSTLFRIFTHCNGA